jgi:hypothetical protein
VRLRDLDQRPGNGSGFCKLHFQQVNQVQSESTEFCAPQAAQV